eukprot:g5674.t1
MSEKEEEKKGSGIGPLFLEDLASSQRMEVIRSNLKKNYYFSLDMSPEFYVAQAFAGFIAVACHQQNKTFLLPELQKEYCVLDFEDLHISRKVRKRSRQFTISIDQDFPAVLSGIRMHHSEDSWLLKKYENLLLYMFQQHTLPVPGYKNIHFRVHSCEVYDATSNKVVAGEVGYSIGSVYTSLTGFFNRKEKSREGKKLKFDAAGNVQLVALALLLKDAGFDFWNLGHPPRPDCMQYKKYLGGKVLSREDFLTRWDAAVRKPLGTKHFSCKETKKCDNLIKS